MKLSMKNVCFIFRLILAFSVSICLLLSSVSSNVFADDVVVSGGITESTTFTLYSDGRLLIDGNGALNALNKWTDFNSLKTYKNDIKQIIINEGITTIPKNSFYYASAVLEAVEYVSFPSTVTEIGTGAFGGGTTKGCKALKTVVFAEGSQLTSIGEYAFSPCESLESINLPEGLETIGNRAFVNCKSLLSIEFPSTLKSFGASPLGGCTGLTTVTFMSMEAPTLDVKDSQTNDYYGLDGQINGVSAEDAGCLRPIELGGPGKTTMRHPKGATGYSDTISATDETGWIYYIGNTWETFSVVPPEVLAVISAIDEIGEITDSNYLEKESTVNAAKDAYDALESQDLKDQVTNYDTLTAAEASIASFKLAAEKTKAKGELDTLLAGKNEADYDADDWTALTKAISDGKDAIDVAMTTDGVNEAKSAAENAVAAIKTKAQKAAEILEATKTEAKGELDTLLAGKNETDYDTDDWTALTKAISDGKDAIDAATTIDGVDAAKTAAENAVSAIKTKEQKAAEKIKKQKAAAKKYKVAGLKVTSKSRKFTLTWKKTKGASGYQIQYRKKGAKKFSSLKTTKLKINTKKLKKGKKYQFRVRTYTKVNGTKVYGKWTIFKTAKCK